MSRMQLCLALVFVPILLFGCAAKQSQLITNTGTTITLPTQPKRVAIEEAGTPKDERFHYVSPPIRLEPDTTWKVPSEGAIAWRHRDYRALSYGLTEWPRWGDAVTNIVGEHNRLMGAKPNGDPKWYQLWK